MNEATMQKFCRIVAKITCCLTVVCLQTQHISAQTQQKVAREQSEFGADSNLDRAVPVPKTAVDLIRSAMQRSTDELPDKLFEASEIHLGSPDEVDLIVLVYVSSHGARFFMLRPTPDSYGIILDSGGDSLKVLRTRSKGYRDILIRGLSQAGRFTTNALYRFNGQQYVEISEKTRPTK
jgi:hypothetical protein